MVMVPKWNKRINQRKIDKSLDKLLDAINRMNNSKAEKSLTVKIRNQESHKRKERQ